MGIELYAERVGPDLFQARGAGGLRNPVLESRPGPEATVFRFAKYVDPRLTEIGRYYDSFNEAVTPLTRL